MIKWSPTTLKNLIDLIWEFFKIKSGYITAFCCSLLLESGVFLFKQNILLHQKALTLISIPGLLVLNLCFSLPVPNFLFQLLFVHWFLCHMIYFFHPVVVLFLRFPVAIFKNKTALSFIEYKLERNIKLIVCELNKVIIEGNENYQFVIYLSFYVFL